MGKWTGLLTSRKFWMAIVSLIVSLGILTLSPDAESEMVEAILTIVAALLPVLTFGINSLGIAIEDAGRAQGGTLKE